MAPKDHPSIGFHRPLFGSLPTAALSWALALLLFGIPQSGDPSIGHVAGPSPHSNGLAPLAAVDSVPVNLSIAPTAVELSNEFWGTTVSARANILPSEGAIINSTPTRLVVWPGGSAGDEYNPLNDSLVEISARTVQWGTPPTSEAEFVDLCRSIHCQAIMQVPGEVDNLSLAESIVNYTEKTLGFRPAFWEIGNEPELWHNWRMPWAAWGAGTQEGKRMITPLQYADELHNFTVGLHLIDPGLRVLGLAGTGRPEFKVGLSDWLNATVAVDGSILAGIAVHSYPAGSTGAPGLVPFYASSNGPYSLAGRIDTARAAIAGELNLTCPACPQIPVYFTEIGSALSNHQYGNFSRQFPGALALAVMVIQGMTLNASNLDLFASVMNTSNSWFDFQGNERPDYTLYSEIFPHLGSEAFPVSLQTPNGSRYQGTNSTLSSDLFGIATRAPGQLNRSDLLLVNDNLTTNVSVAPTLPGPAPHGPVVVWTWQGRLVNSTGNHTLWTTPATPEPTATVLTWGLPSRWTLPPQSLALFEGYPGPLTTVRLSETGVPNGTRWFASVDGRMGTSTGPGRTLLLTEGNHTLSALPIPLPISAVSSGTKGRLEPFAVGSFSVGTRPLSVPVPFVRQWELNLSADPTAGGSVSPLPIWANDSAPLTLTATPLPGYVFTHWVGWGAGGSNSTLAVITISPTGPVREVAFFAEALPVSFVQSGLPAGSNWSVSVRDVLLTGTTRTLATRETNGTYGFSIGPVAGYRSNPTNGSFSVLGSPVRVSVTFIALRPPPAQFSVTWTETGLPNGTSWSILWGNRTLGSNSTEILTSEPDGSYPYAIVPVPGFQARPPSGIVRVDGDSSATAVQFVPERTDFPAVWQETGLWAAVAWWVVVDGTRVNATGGWAMAQLANGSHGFQIGDSGGFTPSPGSGTLFILGAGTNVSVRFLLPTFPVRVSALGLPGNESWTIRISDIALLLASPTIQLMEPNGTYTWVAGAPGGFRPVETHGNLTVTAGPANLTIQFVPADTLPHPSEWSLAGGAALVAGLVALAGCAAFLALSRLRAAAPRSPPAQPPEPEKPAGR
ncbi:MAG: hypothetical protein L3K19_05300 [Thermoplasmata archaeon]|nr:hypothetical protein [Thermoplasmata archaeon]